MDALVHASLNNAGWAAALAVVAAIVARIWRRYPAVVHALWLMVLLKLVTPSIVQFSIRGGDDVSPAEAEEVGAPRSVAAVLPPSNIKTSPLTQVMYTASRPAPERIVEAPPRGPIETVPGPWPWRRALLAVWVIGAFVWWSVVGLGSVRFRRLIGSALPAPPDVVERLGRVATRLGLRHLPTVWMLPTRVPPMLWVPLVGPPRLVLPEELWSGLDDTQRDAVLAHELAHLKRRDHWVRRLEAAVLGLYWWDPVAWWARREVERSEEECCDAWVIWALPQAADAYAEALVATATYLSGLRRPLPTGASGVRSLVSLKRRLAMIVCDSMSASVVRTTPRALLLLGVLSLPFLPGLAAGKPADESGQAGSSAVAPDVSTPAAEPAQVPSAKVVKPPKEASDSQNPDAGKTQPNRKVEVFQPISREVGDYVDIDEPVPLSSQHVDVYTRIQGRVVQVHCRPGQSVARGQLLFEIDQIPYKILLEKAQAAVRQARARQKRCKIELGYSKELSERKGISEKEVALYESKYEEASAAVEEAEADRQLAQENLDATGVISPTNGVLRRIVVRQGEPVFRDSANRSSPMATIVPLDPLYVDFSIDEALARFLDRSRGGRKLKAGENPELPVLISVTDGTGFLHRGQVDFLDPEVQPVSVQAIHLRATIPNPDHALAPGMRAFIRLVTNARHKAILIPQRAWFRSGSSDYVYVVDSLDIVRKRPVRITAPRYPGYLREVEDGLKPDDWVVGYVGDLSEGAKIVPERVKLSVGPE